MQLQTTVAEIRQQTPSVKSFILDCGSEVFNFHAGQWIDIHRTIDDETHTCGYSITSIPSSCNTIEIAAKLAPDLLLTKYLHEECKVGDTLYISQAQGDIWIDKKIDDPYVFIAGGVGITPLYSMIKQILKLKPETSVVLLYSIAHSEEFLFEREIKQLAEQHSEFKYLVTLTRQKKHNLNFSGRISAEILTSINLPKHSTYYLCGPPAMVDAAADLLIQLQSELQLNPQQIFYDKWWA